MTPAADTATRISPARFLPRAAELVAELTLEEKASLCSGADFWHTKGVERLGIQPYMLTDGPHGLRKQASDTDHLGLNNSVPATCFPSGAGLAASWNRELLGEVGRALGREAAAENVGILLGPAINIKRHPLGGRSFEYFSEDPYLTGELAVAYIDGVQSEGVGTSVKHFAANNQEKNRLLVDVVVDERTLREIYLRAFHAAVTRTQPWSVMSAYNLLNGTYASDDPWLLTEVLRAQWGHEGIVVTDWGAEDDRVAGLEAGTSLEMPGSGGLGDREILEAIRAGRLDESVLDREITRLVAVHLAVAEAARTRTGDFDHAAHQALARRAAAEGSVLLKNEGALLPIAPTARIAVVGAFAEHPRYQGGGSSRINPTRLDTLLEGLIEHGVRDVAYAPGYSLNDSEPDETLLAQARSVAGGADVVIVMVGLTAQEESEGYDRSHLRLSAAHNALVEAARSANENVVVVLSNGAPVEMPWVADVPTVLEAYLGGQASGAALADVLLGAAEPSGRLAETFPQRIEDTPAYLNFPGTIERVEYREGIFVGYRHYDTVRTEPLFPFGHGLGYSTIEVAAVAVDRTELDETEKVVVTAELVNTGDRAGSQVVQVYVHQVDGQPLRPEQELVAFEKVALAPGERTTVRIELDRTAFAYWGIRSQDWVVDDAAFEIRVGTSSRAIAFTERVVVHGSSDAPLLRGQNTALGSLLEHPVLGAWARDLRNTFVGGSGDYDADSPEYRLVDAFSRELPLRSLVRIGGLITDEDLGRACRVLDGTASSEDVDRFPR